MEAASQHPHRLLIVGFTPEEASNLLTKLPRERATVAETYADAFRELASEAYSLVVMNQGTTDGVVHPRVLRLQPASGDELFHTLFGQFFLETNIRQETKIRQETNMPTNHASSGPSEHVARQERREQPAKGHTPDDQRDEVEREDPHLQKLLLQLWEKAKDDVTHQVEVIQQATASLMEGSLDDSVRKEAMEDAHKLAGALGTYGMANGTTVAREIEQTFEGAQPLETHARRLAELVELLYQEVQQGPPLPDDAEEEQETISDPDSESFILVHVADGLARRLTKEATAIGTRVHSFDSIEAADEALASQTPLAVLLDLSDPETAQEGLRFLNELASRTHPIPALVLTEESSPIERMQLARLDAARVIDTSMSPKEILSAARRANRAAGHAGRRVLAVDEDPQVLAFIRIFLEPKGLSITTLRDPRNFWDILNETEPDLLLLDINMPYIDGMELCRMVRSDPRWDRLPIIFLTGKVDDETIEKVFAIGADDYLAKPVTADQLATRVLSRLQRAKQSNGDGESDEDADTGLSSR